LFFLTAPSFLFFFFRLGEGFLVLLPLKVIDIFVGIFPNLLDSGSHRIHLPACVFLLAAFVDVVRKSINGLSLLVQEEFELDLFSGCSSESRSSLTCFL
jgi:hypothetical protein